MPNSKSEIYLHFIWGTYNRASMISAEFEFELYQAIRAEIENKGCRTLALGGMDEHLHLLTRMNARISPAELMQQVKGTSSYFINHTYPQYQHFNWQQGYGVFSVSRSHIPRVIRYVENQKHHHAHNKLWPEWEEVVDE